MTVAYDIFCSNTSILLTLDTIDISDLVNSNLIRQTLIIIHLLKLINYFY